MDIMPPPPTPHPLPPRYDRQNTFRRMDDCLFVTAMGPPGGGRNQVRPPAYDADSLLSSLPIPPVLPPLPPILPLSLSL